MDNHIFQLDNAQPNLDLGRQAANAAYEEIWQSTLQTTKSGIQFLGDSAPSVVGGAAGGALIGLGVGKINDVAVKAFGQLAHIPLSIAMTAFTGRAVHMFEPIAVPSSIPRIVPRAAAIGAAVGFASYGAYQLYENYTAKDK